MGFDALVDSSSGNVGFITPDASPSSSAYAGSMLLLVLVLPFFVVGLNDYALHECGVLSVP